MFLSSGRRIIPPTYSYFHLLLMYHSTCACMHAILYLSNWLNHHFPGKYNVSNFCSIPTPWCEQRNQFKSHDSTKCVFALEKYEEEVASMGKRYLSYVFRKQKYWAPKLPRNTNDVGGIHLFLLIWNAPKLGETWVKLLSCVKE